MKTYTVKFDCLIPCEVTTTINAENEKEAVETIIKQEYYYYKYRTTRDFQEIHNIQIEEI